MQPQQIASPRTDAEIYSPPAASPIVWVRPVLAALVEDRLRVGVRYLSGADALGADELTDERGYGAVIAYWTNLRLPGVLPLVSDLEALWGWRVEFDRLDTPVSIVAAAWLDALLGFERDPAVCDGSGADVVVAIDHLALIMMETLYGAPRIIAQDIAGASARD